MLTVARTFANNIKRFARKEAEGLSCIFCGSAIFPSERSLQVQCSTCRHYVNVRDITIKGTHDHPRTITAGVIVVEEGARVSGDLLAQTVIVKGRVLGNILAADECQVLPTGKVAGHILCARLKISPGARVEGTIERVTR